MICEVLPTRRSALHLGASETGAAFLLCKLPSVFPSEGLNVSNASIQAAAEAE